ncbi:MAG: hypothetical protein WBX00_10230 [Isosphaeraceae bacterium]
MRFARIVPQVLVACPPHIIPTLGHGSRGAITTRLMIALAAAFTALLAAAAVAQPPASDPPKKVVIPFDFESKFDNGEYGQTIGDMLWAKLHRQKGFVIPESMQDRPRLVPANPRDPWARDDAREDEGGRRQGAGRRYRDLGQN